MTESNKCQIPGSYTNLVGNIMLIISPLDWIKPTVSSKEENVFVLLKYQDTFIETTLFLSPAYLAAFLFGHRISALFNGLWASIPVSIQAMACLRITSPYLSFKYWSGPVKYCFNYVSIV